MIRVYQYAAENVEQVKLVFAVKTYGQVQNTGTYRK